jgi:hypothetical protein
VACHQGDVIDPSLAAPEVLGEPEERRDEAGGGYRVAVTWRDVAFGEACYVVVETYYTVRNSFKGNTRTRVLPAGSTQYELFLSSQWEMGDHFRWEIYAATADRRSPGIETVYSIPFN